MFEPAFLVGDCHGNDLAFINKNSHSAYIVGAIMDQKWIEALRLYEDGNKVYCPECGREITPEVIVIGSRKSWTFRCYCGAGIHIDGREESQTE